MKTKISTLVFLCLASAVLHSQTTEQGLNATERKDTARLQYNPFSDSAGYKMADIFDKNYINRNLTAKTIGTEISGYFYFRDNPMIQAYGVSLAVYTGQSGSSVKKTGGFSELSQLYHRWFDKPMEYNRNDSYIYLAPGLSVFSKNRKFSFDLYHELSTQPFIEGKQQIVPYKLNFHF